MAVTFIPSGTWTAIPGLVAMDRGINEGSVKNIDLNDLVTLFHGVQLPELRDFIQMAADGWGLKFWPAAIVVEIALKALLNTHDHNVQRSYTP